MMTKSSTNRTGEYSSDSDYSIGVSLYQVFNRGYPYGGPAESYPTGYFMAHPVHVLFLYFRRHHRLLLSRLHLYALSLFRTIKVFPARSFFLSYVYRLAIVSFFLITPISSYTGDYSLCQLRETLRCSESRKERRKEMMNTSKAIELIMKWSKNGYEICRNGDEIYAVKGMRATLLFVLKRKAA